MMIVKIGGGASLNLEAIVADLAKLDEPVILVHGANALRDELAAGLGKEIETVTSVSGFSSVLTNEETIDLMMMAYSGLRNKRLVELCQRQGINAVGLTGLDGRMIEGRRNRGIRTVRNGKKMMLRDLSGKPKTVNTHLLRYLIEGGYTPVLTMPILDENGVAINSENDEVVALLHAEMGADRVVQLIEAPGLLADRDDPQSLIAKLTQVELNQWIERVEGRMKRKLLALSRLLEARPTQLLIGDGRGSQPIRDLLEGKGTRIQCQTVSC